MSKGFKRIYSGRNAMKMRSNIWLNSMKLTRQLFEIKLYYYLLQIYQILESAGISNSNDVIWNPFRRIQTVNLRPCKLARFGYQTTFETWRINNFGSTRVFTDRLVLVWSVDQMLIGWLVGVVFVVNYSHTNLNN